MDSALDTVYAVIGDLSDARGDKKKIDALKDKLREDIRVNENYTKNYPDTKNLNDAETVSYTHLDVYKRQPSRHGV